MCSDSCCDILMGVIMNGIPRSYLFPIPVQCALLVPGEPSRLCLF